MEIFTNNRTTFYPIPPIQTRWLLNPKIPWGAQPALKIGLKGAKSGDFCRCGGGFCRGLYKLCRWSRAGWQDGKMRKTRDFLTSSKTSLHAVHSILCYVRHQSLGAKSSSRCQACHKWDYHTSHHKKPIAAISTHIHTRIIRGWNHLGMHSEKSSSA
jgi:hypothetical protein